MNPNSFRPLATGSVAPVFAPQPGDLALIRGSRFLANAQVLVGRGNRFSHCAVNLSGRVWCHAMPKGGVQLIGGTDLLLDALEGDVVVLRPAWMSSRLNGSRAASSKDYTISFRPAVKRPAVQEMRGPPSWGEAVFYFYGQRYNYFFLRPKADDDHTKFCSELVSEIYSRVGKPIDLERHHYQCTPGDLQELVDDKLNWPSQTSGYASYFKSAKARGMLDFERAQDAAEMQLHQIQYIRGGRQTGRLKCEWDLRLLKGQIRAFENQRDLATGGLGPATALGVGSPPYELMDQVKAELEQLAACFWDQQPYAQAQLEWIRLERDRLAANQGG